MKTLYLLGLIAGLMWIGLGVVVTFATPPDEWLALRLNREPKNWELRVTEESYFLKAAEEKGYNELLRNFIAKNYRASENKRHEGDLAAGVVCVFCLIGWLSERKHEKRNGS